MAEQDLDEELLALAGSGSDSEEEGEASSPKEKLRSRSRSISRPRSITKSPSARSPPYRHRSGSRQPSEDKMSRTALRRADSEEGEASDAPGSPGSLGSGAMEESDSEGSDDGKRAAPGETAIEREQRLAEQAEREEERRKKAKLQALFDTNRAADAAKPSKRKADSADIDDDDYNRRTSRRTAKESSPGAGRKTGRRARKLSDVSDEWRKEDEEAAKKREIDNAPGTLAQYERVRIGRSRIAQVCWTPGFEETFVGAYCRVLTGNDAVSRRPVYRMCEVKGFKEGKPYKIVDNQNKEYMHNVYLIATYGTVEKEYEFSNCSDSRFTVEEFERRNDMLESAGLSQATSRTLENKVAEINKFLEREAGGLTNKEIDQRLARRWKFQHLLANNKPQVITAAMKRDAMLQKRNIENRKKDQEDIREAYKESRRQQAKYARELERKKKEEEEREKRGDAGKKEDDTKFNPWIRRDLTNPHSFSRYMNFDEQIRAMGDFGVDMDIVKL